nr:tripartite tricarboxylate transporter permease [Propylenella binzhouense]
MGLGILLGTYFGAVPGLSGITGMAILLPFTFGMDPVSAFAFLLGMYAVTTTSDSIPAILIGVPGTAAAQASILDGYPLAKRGEASRAFGIAFTCAAIGGVIGAFVMGVSIPIIRPLVMGFAKPEFFALGVLALCMVGALSGSSIAKGVLSAGLGLVLSMVGYSEQAAVPRFWLGLPELLNGIPMIAMVLGIFALPEVVSLTLRGGSISEVPPSKAGGFLTGIRDIVQHRWLTLRAALIGVYVGALPGLGGAIADWMAYGHAVQSAKDKSQFGKGDVRGLIAPEVASNSIKGGDLFPTVAFGIPGSAAMAILLGAFQIQGMAPGPEMLTRNLSITYSFVWTLVIANIIAAIVLSAWTKQLQRIVFIPGYMVVPAILVFVFMGAWSSGTQISDWVILLVFGMFGTAMVAADWPRAPLVLGFVLGPIMENSLHLSVKAYGLSWLGRPIVLVLAAITLLTLFLTIRRALKSGGPPEPAAGDRGDPRISLGVSSVFAAVLLLAIVLAWHWPPAVSRFPLAIAIPTFVVTLIVIFQDARAALRRGRSGGGEPFPFATLGRGAMLYVWLAGIILGTVLVGQLIALPVFVLLFLLVWGSVRWWVAALYAIGCALFLYVTFDQIVHTIWYPALLLG